MSAVEKRERRKRLSTVVGEKKKRKYPKESQKKESLRRTNE